LSTNTGSPKSVDATAVDLRPAPAAGIDPSAPYVEFARHECRARGEVSGMFDARGPEVPAACWDAQHATATGHRRYYLWTITRQTSQVCTVKR